MILPRSGASILAGILFLVALAPAADDLPKMNYNDVKEIAPGVFFRYSSISATDKKVPFGGSNNIWIVFEDYVAVIDANFPKEAGDVIESIKKTTKKPIRYVFDTHHHGDHAYGNAVWAKEGASIISTANCARWLREKGPKEFADAGKGPTGRKDIAASSLKVPNVIFDDKLVLDDGKGQRLEFLHFGHAHTPGDGFAYLPKYKILCTGDACTNGPFNYTGHANTSSWVRVLEHLQQLDVKIICPGHGPLAGKELLEVQKRWFVELRQHVQKGIDANKSLGEIAESIDMPWHKEFHGTEGRDRKENIQHVYAELTGRITPWDLTEEFGVFAGPSPTKETPGWTKPTRIVVQNVMPARLLELKRVAPEIEFVSARSAEEAARLAVDADAVVGFCTPDIVKAGKKLRWVQVGSAGVENYLFAELVKSPIVLTNTQRLYGPNVADQAFALLLSLTRGLREVLPLEVAKETWLKPDSTQQELNGKNALIVGLGGIGMQLSRRAHGFGMRVIAVDPKEMDRPDFVFSLDKPEKLLELLPKADVVIIACPLTDATRGMIGPKHFAAMKPSAYFINIARGGIVQTPALLDALSKKQIAGAGLDVTDPEPLPSGHPLWKFTNVVISPHIGGQSPEARDRAWRLYRENIRRFAVGEPLLCVVDKVKGY